MNRLRPRVLRLNIGRQCRNSPFRFVFGSINAGYQHIPRLPVTGRLINHIVFQIRFLRPTVEVVIVRRTAQLQRVVAGWRRLQRTYVARRFTCSVAGCGCSWCGSGCSRCGSGSSSRRCCRYRRFRCSRCGWCFHRLTNNRFRLSRCFYFRCFYHGLRFDFTLRLNHRLLTFRTRCSLCLVRFGFRSGGLRLSATTTNRCDSCRFSWQRRVSHYVVHLFLVLRLRQRIVQVTLNFYTLLAFWRSRCLTLSRGRRDWRQRNILLRVVCRGLVLSDRLAIARLSIVRLIA